MTRMIPPALALAFALSCSAVWGEASDWALVLPTGEIICAKEGMPGRPPDEPCELARRAIERGWWPVMPSGSGIRCERHPDCFDQRSLCIEGYSC
jgi:hypothetical protein